MPPIADDITTQTDTGEIVYEVVLGGEVLPPATGLLSIVVEHSINRIGSAQIILMDDDTGDEPYPLSNQDTTKPGTEVEIKAGYGDTGAVIFKGIVVNQRMKINQRKSNLILECKDAAVKMTMIKKSAYYYEIKDSDVWDQLINAAGLQADITATTVTNKEMVQYSCTDWDFIVSRAETNGMFVITADGIVKIMKPVSVGVPVVVARYGDNMFEFDAAMDARTQLKDIKATTWDSSQQQTIEETSAEPVLASNGDLSGDDLAAAIGGESYQVKHSGNIATDELKTWADAKLMKSRLAKIRGRVKLSGNGVARPGELMGLQGVGDHYNGDVMVSGVRHEIARGTWMTDIQFGLSPNWYIEETDVNTALASAMLPAIQGLQIGVVTLLEDVDGAYRIKVRIPMISADDEGIWARQGTIDAGDNRGWVIRPEIGDEVIVGFINNDPRDAVVLGALHSGKNTAPIAAKDDNDEKGWLTRSGIKIMVDDKKKSIEISTPAGNKMVMDEDAKTITLQDQNSNKMEMSSDGITIESSKDIILKATGDVKADGINITLKATASLKSEGSASAEIKSSGQTAVKGGIVMIN